jgi:hypothetical protein
MFLSGSMRVKLCAREQLSGERAHPLGVSVRADMQLA